MQPTGHRQQVGQTVSAAVFFFILALCGCATSEAGVVPYPETDEARAHYLAGDQAMKQGHYETAIKEFNQSIKLEPSPFLSHAWLASAYFANRNFTLAAGEFEKATDLVGSVESGGPLPIMQVLSLMRAGDKIKAQQLLRKWTSSPVISAESPDATPGRLLGMWRMAAVYLLGNVAEDEYLRRTPQQDISFSYLFIGINSLITNKRSKAESSLQMAFETARKGTWRRAIAKAELDRLKQVR